MNRYGVMAREHWARWLPARYAAISDLGSFFSGLGTRAEQRIDSLAAELAGDDAGRSVLGEGGAAGRGPAPGRADRAVLAGVAGQLAAEPFRPSGHQDLAPPGAATRIAADIAAVATLRTIERDGRAASQEEQRVLARWSGWGAVREVFDDTRPEYARARDQLARLLSPEEMAATARNTLNAHYTDAAHRPGRLVRGRWRSAWTPAANRSCRTSPA